MGGAEPDLVLCLIKEKEKPRDSGCCGLGVWTEATGHSQNFNKKTWWSSKDKTAQMSISQPMLVSD